jgi:peptide/nickel transport system permease protein
VVAVSPKKTRVRRAGRVTYYLAIFWIVLVVLLAVFAGILPLHNYGAIVDSLQPRAAPHLGAEFLGTDATDRSVLSRLIFGARSSMIVAVSSVLIAMVAGLVIGVIAGFFRRWADAVISIVVDAVLAVPALVLLLAFASVGSRSLTTIIIGLGLVGTPTFARLARATTLSLAERDFVTAARVLGAGRLRVMVRELLPTVILRTSSFAFIFMATVVVAEGSLSFLGLGVPPPSPSWGGMINDGRPFLAEQPYLVFIPAICIFLTVASFTVVGDHVRRHFDTRESVL